jgi:hypothetical protein
MNWGTKIIIGMLSFMTFIVVLAVLMFRSDSDALVETNYYEKGLNYDEEYAAKTQVGKDQASPEVTINSRGISIIFKTSAKGQLKLTRNDSKSSDTTVRFITKTGKLNLDISKLAKGRWHMITSWENPEGIKYLKDEEVQLP